MADLGWGIGLAVGVQTALGTKNATIEGLTGALDSTDGIVLGHRDSGDAESGIAIPEFTGDFENVADVVASFTKQAGLLNRVTAEGLAITVPWKGNGVASTPSTGQAAPLAGIDALLQMSGLVSANGTDPVVNYTPRHAGSSGGATIYGSIMLWIADKSFFLYDSLVDSLEFQITPAGVVLATFNINVGAFDKDDDFSTGVTIPTFDYTTQASLKAPICQGMATSWGSTRGPRTLTVTIQNGVTEEPDGNQATGVRLVQEERTIQVEGELYVDSGDSDHGYQQLAGDSAPTDDMTFQVGAVASPTDTLNAFSMAINNLDLQTHKYNRVGANTIEEIAGNATATAAGGEFQLQFN